MAEFTVVTQWLDLVDPTLGPVAEELRTLQVKRPASAVQQKEARKQWQRFGAAKGKVGAERGVTDILKEDVIIEPPSEVWGIDEDDKIAHRLVSTAGRMTISRYNSAPQASGGASGHSRKNSGEVVATSSSSRKNSTGSTASAGHSRSNSGSLPPQQDPSLPAEPPQSTN